MTRPARTVTAYTDANGGRVTYNRDDGYLAWLHDRCLDEVVNVDEGILLIAEARQSAMRREALGWSDDPWFDGPWDDAPEPAIPMSPERAAAIDSWLTGPPPAPKPFALDSTPRYVLPDCVRPNRAPMRVPAPHEVRDEVRVIWRWQGTAAALQHLIACRRKAGA